MFDKLLEKINSNVITFESWILSATGIIFVRIFLEQYSNNAARHYVLIDPSTIVQYWISFIAILLWCLLVILYFGKRTLKETALVSLFGFIVICTPPLWDLLISKGSGFNIHYLFLNAHDLVIAYLTGLWSTAKDGMTYGIRIEILIVFFTCMGIVYSYTKNIWRSLLAAILMYSGIFFVVSIPSFMGLFQNEIPVNFIAHGIVHSKLIENSIFSIVSQNPTRLLELGFNSLMIQMNALFALVSIILICIFAYKHKARILLGNARPERILHYSLLIVLGSIFGGGGTFFYSWVNIISLLMTIIAFIFAWLSAVCLNDIHDEDIDTISNAKRPLPLKQFTRGEFSTLTRVFFILSLLFAYSASLYGLFFVILYSIIYYVYSAHPLKIKRHYIGGIITIGVASISAVCAGFFLAGDSKELLSLSPLLLFMGGLLVGVASMIKDLKDYEGDKACNIKTLPVVLGLQQSKLVIASLLTLGFLGVGFYVGNKIIIGAGIVASLLIWKILLAKIYKEKYFFITYLSFLLICILVFILR